MAQNLNKIREGILMGYGGWFIDNIGSVVGGGSNTLFWHGSWLEGSPFTARFRRLYDLSEHKLTFVAERHSLGWGVNEEAWWISLNLKVFNIIWLSVVWIIWKERNRRIFKNKENHLQSIIEKVKLKTFWLLKSSCYIRFWLSLLGTNLISYLTAVI